MAQNWYPASSLIGGVEGSLDSIDGDYLFDGDRAFVITNSTVNFYILDGDSGLTENSPDVISPDVNAGTKRWILIPTASVNLWVSYSDDEPSIAPITPSSSDSVSKGIGNKVVESSESVILYDVEGEIVESDDSVIVGPYNNKIHGGGDHFIAGGGNHIITNNEWDSAIVGGWRNIIRASESFIGGGDYNECESDYSALIGGVYGRTYVNYQQSFGFGYFSRFSAGKTPQGSFLYLAIGDAQMSVVGRKNVTTSATPVVLSTTLKPSGQRLWQFKISVSAFQTAGTGGTVGDSAFWNITGGLKKTAGTAAQGTIQVYLGSASAGDTFNVCGTVFTFVDKENPGFREIPIGANYEEICWYLNLNLKGFYARSYTTSPSGITQRWIEVTSKDHTTADNALTFSESSAILNMDGAGTFGGTTAGVDGTVAFVGTVQGDGVPGANDRDAGAAAWDCTVTANDTDKRLDITVTGEADKTIHWVAKIELVEVG